MASEPYPRTLAHVGITVPDVDEAMQWYRNVLGWRRLKPPRKSRGNQGYGGRRAVDLLGEYEEMKVVQLVTGNGIGIELFEFPGVADTQEPDFKERGYSHICVVDPDVSGLATKIDQAGGDHYSDVWRLYEDTDEYLLTYCKDPFGNLIEIYSHSHEQMHATPPCDEQLD